MIKKQVYPKEISWERVRTLMERAVMMSRQLWAEFRRSCTRLDLVGTILACVLMIMIVLGTCLTLLTGLVSTP